MKFNIQKLQEGGATAPWVQYDPFFQPTQPTTTTTKGTTKSTEDNVSKQLNTLLNSMVGKGLTNEVNHFAQQVGELLGDYEAMGLPITARTYSGIVAQLNAIQNNKAIYDAARKHAAENGTLSSAAITTDGRMYAQTSNGITLITPDEYVNDRKSYRLLSNEELLTMRNNSQALIYDTTLSETVGQSMSIDDINKSIDEAVKMIQKEDSSTETYVNKARKTQFDKGMQAIINYTLHDAPEGALYKINVSESSQRNYIKAALTRIWSKLPQHAKNTLIAHAAQNFDEDPREMAIQSIQQLLVYGTYYGREVSVSDADIDPATGAPRGIDMSGQYTDTGPFEIYAGAPKMYNYKVRLDPAAKAYEWETDANVGPLIGTKGESLTYNYVSTIISDYGFSGLLNAGGASFGTGTALSDMDLAKCVYATEDVATAWLPFKYNDAGNKIVDLEVMKKLKAADEELKTIPNASMLQKEAIYKKHGVLEYLIVGNQATPEQLQKMAQFMVMPVYVPEDVAEKHKLDTHIPHLDNKQEEEAFDIYKQVQSKGKNEAARKSGYTPTERWGMGDDDMYKASLFIPLQTNVELRNIAGGDPPLEDKTRQSRQAQEYSHYVGLRGNRYKDTNSLGLN